jgi:ubiquinone/menaquinone biosynthesis C-methylase UbiE
LGEPKGVNFAPLVSAPDIKNFQIWESDVDHKNIHEALISSNEKQTFLSYYSKIDEDYGKRTNTKYHMSRVHNISKIMDIHLEGKNDAACVDFGCGDGLFSEIICNKVGNVICIDPSEKLIDKAKIRMSGCDGAKFIVGDVKNISNIPSDSCQAITSLDVLDYLEKDEEELFYSEASRILMRGGKIISTHSNELFDLFTFNRYTVNFFKRHFSVDVESLVVNPTLPIRSEANIRGNPLSHRHKVAKYGFKEIDQAFLMLHPQPPLLNVGHDPDDLNGRTFPDTWNWPPEDQWKLMFMCSVFCSVSEKS